MENQLKKNNILNYLFICLILIFFLGNSLHAVIYHVNQKSLAATDSGPGTEAQPFMTINKGAQTAQPGDTVLAYAGVYREDVMPVEGGTAGNPIIYKAKDGNKVYIKGSEVINSWVLQGDGTWQVTLTPSFFGSYQEDR